MKKILAFALATMILSSGLSAETETERYTRIHKMSNDAKSLVKSGEQIKETIVQKDEIREIPEPVLTETEKIIINLENARNGLNKIINKKIEKEYAIRDINDIIETLKRNK